MWRVIIGALVGVAVGAALGILPGLREPSWSPLPGSDVGVAIRGFQRDFLLAAGALLGGGCGGVVGAIAAAMGSLVLRREL
jgi:hypothetical protein